MFKIKQLPEDFFVREIPNKDFKKKGTFAVFLLKKTNYTTEKAIQTICTSLIVQRKHVGYAGIKDRNAITEQYISILNAKSKNLELNDIKLQFQGYLSEPISLGDLKGNYFEIVIRNLEKEQTINSINYVPNYFDEQRFSKNNVQIGRYILKRDFKNAVLEMLKSNGDYEKKVAAYLKDHDKDYVGALRRVPKKILLLFVHAYQSYLFNITIKKYLKECLKTKQKENQDIPLIGFGMEIPNQKIEKIITDLMNEENITTRDFIIREIPELSSEGGFRKLFAEIQDLTIGTKEKDELNKGKYKLKVAFSLSKGSYATIVIKELFK
ncbi:MAG: tRNA pseudouridine(13) synthase TruD [Nanoarchaeota archaeon]|nr:tRNA pseudouridine(13) synthase TruD [Nanoarchaeota archaeon]MBU1030446.1 tRNA pseudouridine(13) synthase TruD [Nanoarchaeota archaeon]MBU1849771.1 tRNA pseudouridine(13) synthase TruD [Nanoarchaeota archaeon]